MAESTFMKLLSARFLKSNRYHISLSYRVAVEKNHDFPFLSNDHHLQVEKTDLAEFMKLFLHAFSWQFSLKAVIGQDYILETQESIFM